MKFFKKKENKGKTYAPVAVYPEFEDVKGNNYNLSIVPNHIGTELWYSVQDATGEEGEEIILGFFQWMQHAVFFCETFHAVTSYSKEVLTSSNDNEVNGAWEPQEPKWPTSTFEGTGFCND